MRHTKKTIRKTKSKEYAKSSRGNTWMNGQSNEKNAIAFCHNPKHVGYLNCSLMKNHRCLEKQCRYLQKYEEKEYWIKKSIKQALKKLRKHDDYGYIYINGEVHFTDNLDKLYRICKDELNKTGKVPIVEYRNKLIITRRKA